jgi:hypothetical protein
VETVVKLELLSASKEEELGTAISSVVVLELIASVLEESSSMRRLVDDGVDDKVDDEGNGEAVNDEGNGEAVSSGRLEILAETADVLICSGEAVSDCEPIGELVSTAEDEVERSVSPENKSEEPDA